MIISILEGQKISRIARDIKSMLRKSSNRLDFERAASLRDQLVGLKQILLHRPVLSGTHETSEAWRRLQDRVQTLLGINTNINRVEAYDISNISGVNATGSMVVFTNGAPDKREYRKFRIKTVKGANDVAMIAEVIRRRFHHREWQAPDIIVLDGGKPQLNAALKVYAEKHIKAASILTALAKRDEELFLQNAARPIQLKKEGREVLHFFQRIRDEAHRFARKYHHKLREKELKGG